jgi:hypothetical protein
VDDRDRNGPGDGRHCPIGEDYPSDRLGYNSQAGYSQKYLVVGSMQVDSIFTLLPTIFNASRQEGRSAKDRAGMVFCSFLAQSVCDHSRKVSLFNSSHHVPLKLEDLNLERVPCPAAAIQMGHGRSCPTSSDTERWMYGCVIKLVS